MSTVELQGGIGYMAWATPQSDRQQVNRCGDLLISDEPVVFIESRDRMLQVISNWRSSHAFPLQCLKMTLLRRAKRVDPKAIVAQRLKRMSSIEAKLRRFPEMKLSQMQDIGDCRAVVDNIGRLTTLISLYDKSRAKNPTRRHEFIHDKNYVVHPKPDGYRGVHFIYRYRSMSKKHRAFNGLKIEIQLRTRLQHAWATAVETVSIFTGQALKANAGEGDWRRFFALMSNAIALREKTAPVPGTPTDKIELIGELRMLTDKLNVVRLLRGWSYALTTLPAKNLTDAVAFLVVLDTEKYTLQTTGFTKGELPKASEAYWAVEKESRPGTQAVLVSLDSVHAIRSAYPNYYLDTGAFIRALQFAIR